MHILSYALNLLLLTYIFYKALRTYKMKRIMDRMKKINPALYEKAVQEAA